MIMNASVFYFFWTVFKVIVFKFLCIRLVTVVFIFSRYSYSFANIDMKSFDITHIINGNLSQTVFSIVTQRQLAITHTYYLLSAY